MSHACHRFWKCHKTLTVCSLWQGAQSLRLPRETTSQRPKVVRTPCVFNILTSEMCFAPQRRALFRHLNVQKCSEPGVFCTFWLRNVLRATTACTFSTSQFAKVLRSPGALYILTSKCASRHNGVQFLSLIWPDGSAPAALASLLFATSSFLRTFIFFLLTLFSSLIFSLLLFSLLLFSFLLFSSLWLFPALLFICPYCRKMSEVWLLNFLRLTWFN